MINIKVQDHKGHVLEEYMWVRTYYMAFCDGTSSTRLGTPFVGKDWEGSVESSRVSSEAGLVELVIILRVSNHDPYVQRNAYVWI